MSGVDLPRVREDGLQLEEHRGFQKRLWIAQRIAWVCFALLLLAALAGLTGSGGPLSTATEQVAGGEITYPRFTRWADTDSLQATFGPGEGERSLLLSPSFTEGFQIDGILPQPIRAEALPEGQRLIFDAAQGAQVTLHLTTQRPGLISFEAALDGGPATEFLSIALP
jgi:hypothetical protein